MRVAIVGHAAEKFTPLTEARARALIRMFLYQNSASHVVSGGCHMGGIDIWAEEEADRLGIAKQIYTPSSFTWGAPGGFKERNLQIARDCDVCYCIVVKDYPPDYAGMRFKYCYHCKTDEHIKSGGCWTVKQAKLAGARGEIHVLA